MPSQIAMSAANWCQRLIDRMISAANWPTNVCCSLAYWCQLLIGLWYKVLIGLLMSVVHWPTNVSRSLANWHELLIGQMMSAANLPTDIKDLRIYIRTSIFFYLVSNVVYKEKFLNQNHKINFKFIKVIFGKYLFESREYCYNQLECLAQLDFDLSQEMKHNYIIWAV